MIIYDLECSLGHRFEGWFANIKAFEEQRAKGLIFCAVCGMDSVRPVPSGGHIQGPSKETPAVLTKANTPLPQPSLEKKEIAANVDPVTLLKAVDHYVRTNFKNVGAEFAKKAVEMHEGKSPAESIYGTATKPEQELLEEKGISFTLLPKLPESTEN